MHQYRAEKSENIMVHIPVHAIYKAVYLELFGEKALQRDVKWSQGFPDYKRSWDIVERDGYENIIKVLNPKYKAKKAKH